MEVAQPHGALAEPACGLASESRADRQPSFYEVCPPFRLNSPVTINRITTQQSCPALATT